MEKYYLRPKFGGKVVVCAIAFIAMCRGERTACDEGRMRDRVRITSTIEKIKDDHFISFVIENKSDKKVVIREHKLPWGSASAIILKAVMANALGDEIKQSLLFDDPSSVVSEIGAGKKLSGKIDLTSRFPALEDTLRAHDVIIFWSYQLVPVEGEPIERTGGWFEIKRGEKK